MKIVEIAIIMVLGNVEDECTFSMLVFMKNKLNNILTIHMHLQGFTLENFPYDVPYDDWKTKVKKKDSLQLLNSFRPLSLNTC
jgi:hypothetical protein